MATEKERLNEFWGQNHEILFWYNEIEYFAFKQIYDNGKRMQVLCNDGQGCKSRVVETEENLLDTEYKGKKVRDMIREGEIEWIF